MRTYKSIPMAGGRIIEYGDVTIILRVPEEELRGVTLITGFHGVGFVGYITTKHIVHELEPELIGFIRTKHMPPYVAMRAEGRIQTPYEIYRRDNVVLVLTEWPLNSRDFYDFSFALAEWSIRCGFERAILVGGLDVRTRGEDEKALMRCAATSAYIRRYGCELPLLERSYFIVGPLALMMACYEMREFPAIAILPYASPERPDPRAAAVAVEYIAKELGLRIITDRLIEEAEKIEQELREISEKQREREEKEWRALYV